MEDVAIESGKAKFEVSPFGLARCFIKKKMQGLLCGARGRKGVYFKILSGGPFESMPGCVVAYGVFH